MGELLARWGLIAACASSLAAGQPAPPQPCPGAFAVAMPADWRSADRLMLRARDVSVAKNATAVLEFHAAAAGESAMLGSYGVVAESETAAGAWTFEVLQVNVTRPLRRWLENHPGSSVCVQVRPVDGSRQPLPRLAWKARAIEIDAVRER